MFIPLQLAPTMGLAHGGVEFLEGSLLGIEKFTIFRRGKFPFRRIYVSFKFTSLDWQYTRFENLGVSVLCAAAEAAWRAEARSIMETETDKILLPIQLVCGD